MRRRLSATMVALLVLAGCESAGDDDGGTPSTAATALAETSPEEPPGSQGPTSEEATTDDPDVELYPFVGGPDEQEGLSATEPQEITGARTGLHDGYDRVVLDLTGDEPVLGWYADFVDEAVQDPSGLAIDIEGEAFLQIAVRGIDWTTESPERYSGDPVEGSGTEVVTEVAFGGLFEGQQQIVVGLTEETAFRVFSLSDPARIVIDVQHP
jgi:hypothetical protein